MSGVVGTMGDVGGEDDENGCCEAVGTRCEGVATEGCLKASSCAVCDGGSVMGTLRKGAVALESALLNSERELWVSAETEFAAAAKELGGESDETASFAEPMAP